MGAIASPTCAKGHKWSGTVMQNGKPRNVCAICAKRHRATWAKKKKSAK